MRRIGSFFVFLGLLCIAIVVLLAIALAVTAFFDMDTMDMLTDCLKLFMILIFVFIILGAIISSVSGAKDAAVMRKTAPSAYASLISAQMGSWDSDDSPQIPMHLMLKFVTNKHEIITATYTVYAAFPTVSTYEPQKGYPIRYETENPKVVMLDERIDPEQFESDRLFFIKVIYGVSPDKIQMRKEAERVLGVIMESKPTGHIVNNCSEMELTLNVIKDSGDEFIYRTVEPVPQDFLEYTIPGSVLPIYYKHGREEESVVWFYDEKVGKA